MSKEVDVDLLRQLLRCEPETGKLYWLERPVEMFEDGGISAKHKAAAWNSRYAGEEAFTSCNNGYRHGLLLSSAYRAHRVIWALVHGEWPEGDIDHINGVRDDNRLFNLRVVTRQENMRNMRLRDDNTSGVPGIYWRKDNSKWMARIQIDSRESHLGQFDDFDEAVAVRKAAEIEHCYHPNHGRSK